MPTLEPTVLVSAKKPHETSPKKRLARELPAEDSTQEAGGQVLTTAEANIPNTQILKTAQPHIFIESHAIPNVARRPEGPIGEPSTQMEAFATDAAIPNPYPSSSRQHQLHNQDLHQQTKTLEDMQQDSKEEIEAIVEDELVRLRRENECLRLVQ
jgi:hypothetical protein